MSRIILVVENTRSLPASLPGVEVVSARRYLTESRFFEMKRAKVFNLCRNVGYQTMGYYVSLLAEARGHRHLPSLATITALREAAVLRIVSSELDELIQSSLSALKSDQFELSIYFGKNLAGRYDRLSQALFGHYPAPLLRARFTRKKRWKLVDLATISLSDVPESHLPFLVERATGYFERRRTAVGETYRYDLAILVDPDAVDRPSGDKAISRFMKAAKKVGMRPFLIDKDEYPRISEYDALFIRETTGVNHYTYRFAQRAMKDGLVVIDDPDSILRCCNKVYQAELFEKQKIPCPKTMIVHSQNRAEVSATLGLPCVLKRPDSSFSLGVEKASTEAELAECLDRFLDDSSLVVAQSYIPSDFDWRIGVLDGKVLFVCHYYMAKGHWQIQKTESSGKRAFGKHSTLSVEDAPPKVIEVALAAAKAVGRGLYGVDVKETDGQVYVMEVNDNPNIDAGVEDEVVNDELYLTIMNHFAARLEERGRVR